jgi:hypothetical protein
METTRARARRLLAERDVNQRKIRFTITHVNADGLRALTLANQGRNHYDTREEADAALEKLKTSLRERILGDRADTLLVSEIECYGHGDAVGIYVDHVDGDPCPHGRAWRVVDGKPRIDCTNWCAHLYT